MNRKGPWEGYRRQAKRRLARCLLPAFLCAHIFIKRETSGYEAGKDKYLSVEIRFRISRSIANPKSGFLNLNPDFLIERTLKLACKNSGLFSPLGTFRRRNIPSREEKGETAVFAGYINICGSRTYIHIPSMHGYSKFPGDKS